MIDYYCCCRSQRTTEIMLASQGRDALALTGAIGVLASSAAFVLLSLQLHSPRHPPVLPPPLVSLGSHRRAHGLSSYIIYPSTPIASRKLIRRGPALAVFWGRTKLTRFALPLSASAHPFPILLQRAQSSSPTPFLRPLQHGAVAVLVQPKQTDDAVDAVRSHVSRRGGHRRPPMSSKGTPEQRDPLRTGAIVNSKYREACEGGDSL